MAALRYGMPINESDTKWVYREDYYCPGSNMDPIKHPELYEHQCFAKCLRDEECKGEGHEKRRPMFEARCGV